MGETQVAIKDDLIALTISSEVEYDEIGSVNYNYGYGVLFEKKQNQWNEMFHFRSDEWGGINVLELPVSISEKNEVVIGAAAYTLKSNPVVVSFLGKDAEGHWQNTKNIRSGPRAPSTFISGGMAINGGWLAVNSVSIDDQKLYFYQW